MSPEVPARLLRLVLITPGDREPDATRALAEAGLEGGVSAVLLREPQLDPDAREALAHALARITRAAGAGLLVHRDPRLARACGADAVHTGHGGASVDELRASAAGLAVGRSAHWPPARQDRIADYVLLSPFRPTPRSHPRPLLSADQVAAVLGTPDMPPVVALGGLGATDVAALPDGLAGVAVMRAIVDADDACAAARALREALAARYPETTGTR